MQSWHLQEVTVARDQGAVGRVCEQRRGLQGVRRPQPVARAEFSRFVDDEGVQGDGLQAGCVEQVPAAFRDSIPTRE